MQHVTLALGELQLNLGLLDVVFGEHPILAEGWAQRLEEIVGWSNNQISEVQSFGEAYDCNQDAA